MEKIHMVQEIIITLQNLLDDIASLGERIKKYQLINIHCIIPVECSLLHYILYIKSRGIWNVDDQSMSCDKIVLKYL